jgi:hypothetical protein
LFGRFRESHDDHHRPDDGGRRLHHVMRLSPAVEPVIHDNRFLAGFSVPVGLPQEVQVP